MFKSANINVFLSILVGINHKLRGFFSTYIHFVMNPFNP